MKRSHRSIQQVIEEQIKKWQLMQNIQRGKSVSHNISVVTISREPGSGGKNIADGVAQIMEMDLFDEEIVEAMTKDSERSKLLVETLDERGFSMIEDWISAAISDRHLWPDNYMKVLLKIVGTIGKHGNAVILGRGANFIIPPENRLSVRIIAPLKLRVQKVAKLFEVSTEDAMYRIKRTEANRRAFVRKYFYTNISDPSNYDIVLNTENITIDHACGIIRSYLKET